MIDDKNDKNEIKKQVIYLYVCYWPGLVRIALQDPGVRVVLSAEGVLLSVEQGERKSR